MHSTRESLCNPQHENIINTSNASEFSNNIECNQAKYIELIFSRFNQKNIMKMPKPKVEKWVTTNAHGVCNIHSGELKPC